MIDELVKMVAKKVNISEAQAKTAVDTVLNFLKERLPAPIAAQIDNVIGGKGGDVLGGLGGMLGGKK